MPGISSNLCLTARQAQVLELLRQGLTRDQAAARLGVSRRTVDFHAGAALYKSGSNNVRHAIAFYYESTLRPEYAPRKNTKWDNR